MSKIVSDIYANKIDAGVINVPPTSLSNMSNSNIVISTASGSNSATSGTNAGSAHDVVITGGDGGAHTATTGTSTGGAGGDITVTAGSGGAAVGGSAGAGGTVTITSGDGANSTSGTDGAGGEIALVPGSAGGTATTDGFVHITQNPPLVCYTAGTTQSISVATTLTSSILRAGVGELTDGGIGVGFALTLPTGTVTSGLFSSVTAGDTFQVLLYNITTQTATITTAAGLTLHGTVAVPNNTTALITYRNTAANTYDVYIHLSA